MSVKSFDLDLEQKTKTCRAISITTIAMMIVILLVDGAAHARIEAYKKQLELVNK